MSADEGLGDREHMEDADSMDGDEDQFASAKVSSTSKLRGDAQEYRYKPSSVSSNQLRSCESQN